MKIENKIGKNCFIALDTCTTRLSERSAASDTVGRALDWGSKACKFGTHRWWSHCVVSLSKTLYSLVSTVSRHDRKFVDWNVKHQNIENKHLCAMICIFEVNVHYCVCFTSKSTFFSIMSGQYVLLG